MARDTQGERALPPRTAHPEIERAELWVTVLEPQLLDVAGPAGRAADGVFEPLAHRRAEYGAAGEVRL